MVEEHTIPEFGEHVFSISNYLQETYAAG